MSARKPLDEACTGGIFCPVQGHVKVRVFVPRGKVLARSRTSHIPLTDGQRKTLRERRAEQRKQQT